MFTNLNPCHFVSTVITSFQSETLSFSLINQKVKLIGILLLGTAGLVAGTYWIYRLCFQAKDIRADLDESAETAKQIGQQKLAASKAKEDVQLSKASVIKSAEELHTKFDHPIFPTLGDGKSTAIDQVKALYDAEIIVNALQNTQVLVHPSVSALAESFLQYKLKFGSKIEKQLYAFMSKEDFIARLMIKRPFVFMCSSDYFVLKDRTKGRGGFELIGSDKEKNLHLADYLSYDEMEIAAMIGVSVPTHFINKGDSYNQGIIDLSDNYEKEGICLGLVGARLEREGYMEYQRLMVTPTQNTKENGYGPLPGKEEDDNVMTAKMRLFAKFYNVDYFPTYDEVSTLQDAKIHYAKCDEGFISEELYKHRIKINIENYLHDANARAGERERQAYAQPYGWGLSAWIKDNVQRQWFIEAFLEVIENGYYPHISDVDFSFVMKYQKSSPGLQQFRKRDGEVLNQVKVHFPALKGCRELCAKLTGEHAGKLLINSYGWDGNSYCGNEYWDSALTASGDPIMMCAAPLVVFAQVPEINLYLTKNLNFIFACPENRWIFSPADEWQVQNIH